MDCPSMRVPCSQTPACRRKSITSWAQRSGSSRIRHDAGAIGLEMAAVDEVSSIEPSRGDVAAAVGRLAAAGTGY